MRAEVLAMVERAQTAASAALVLPAEEAEGYAATLRRHPRDAIAGYSEEEQSERDEAAAGLAELIARLAPQPA
jgi:hypothetical protein